MYIFKNMIKTKKNNYTNSMDTKGGGSLLCKFIWLPFAIVVLISCSKFNHFTYLNLQTVFKSTSNVPDNSPLREVLDKASMENKTVIITFLNEAWAAPNSVFDVFLESFRRGNQTEELIKHIVVITVDQKAYARCSEIHQHCYDLSSKGNNNSNTSSGELYFMTQAYFDLMWRRVEFLLTVVELGYNFIFTDCDIMWFRNPFPKFYPDVDFQIACDYYKGNPKDLRNPPNGGFIYMLSSKRSIEFYKFWYASRKAFPGLNEQDVFNKIKFHPFIKKIRLKIRFLDTKYFGGFCQPSKDFDQVCTMHANCCFGLENKVYDLNILLQDWTRFWVLKANGSSSKPTSWTAPQKCLHSYHPPDPPRNETRHL